VYLPFQVRSVNRSSRRLEIHCPTISQYHWYLNKVNGMDTVFLQERYGIYQLGGDYDLEKLVWCGDIGETKHSLPLYVTKG
jgi:hypothetical protein